MSFELAPRLVAALIAVGVLSGVIVPEARAQTPSAPRSQTNFKITPPPLGYQEYGDAIFKGAGEAFAPVSWSLGAGGLVALIRGERSSINAFGVQVTPRMPFGPAAVSLPVALVRMSGNVMDIDMSFWAVNVGPAAELNLVQTPTLRGVVFGGYSVSWSYATFTLYDLPYPTTTVDTGVMVSTLMHGPLVGAQVSILAIPDFVVTPHASFRSMAGTAKPDTMVGLWSALERPIDIPRFSSTVLGLDVVYTPLALTLSGLADLASPSGDNERVKTYVFTLGWTFRP